MIMEYFMQDFIVVLLYQVMLLQVLLLLDIGSYSYFFKMNFRMFLFFCIIVLELKFKVRI